MARRRSAARLGINESGQGSAIVHSLQLVAPTPAVEGQPRQHERLAAAARGGAEFSVRYAPERRRQSPPPRWDFNRDGTLSYFGYGASRRYGNTADSGRKPLESSGDESLFVDEAELLNAEEWFVQMSHSSAPRAAS